MRQIDVKNVQNNKWWHLNNRETVIVFVHGLLSSSAQCWKHKKGTFWPELIKSDPVFSDVSIFMGGYHTQVDAGSYGIENCTNELFRELKNSSSIDTPAVMDFQRIVFVCHSLGGVICRRMLEENSASFRGKDIGLVLMASPSMGSSYATSLQAIGKAYNSRVVSQLVPKSEVLTDLDRRFKKLLADNNRSFGLCGAEATEHHGPIRFKWLPFLRSQRIVDESSSSRYFGEPTVLPGTDHSTIVKPEGHEDESHKFLRNFFKEQFAPRNQKSPNRALGRLSASAIVQQPDPTFEVYAACHEPYYVARDVDQQIANVVGCAAVWITGASGLGKTSAMKRYVLQNNENPIELSLTALSDQNIAEALAREIGETIALRTNTPRLNSLREVVHYLAHEASLTGIVLFIDEIPLGNAEACEAFVNAIVQLVDQLNRQATDAGQSKKRITLCSIVQPHPEAISDKARELISFIQCKPWSHEELSGLFNKITSASVLPTQLSRVLEQQARVISLANGSPRTIKIFFRNLLASYSSQASPGLDFERALEHATSQIGGQS